jgi:hypothetical protein
MDLGFEREADAALFNNRAKLQRKLGAERAKEIRLRFDQITGSPHLEALCKLPQARCHPLTANRHEQFYLDLEGPNRLLVEVGDEPIPRLLDGGIDRNRVTRLWFIEITDTHQ